MTKYALLMMSALAFSAAPALAQDAEAPALPPVTDAANFVPFIAPALAGLGIIAVASGGSTTSTTSTTTTTTN